MVRKSIERTSTPRMSKYAFNIATNSSYMSSIQQLASLDRSSALRKQESVSLVSPMKEVVVDEAPTKCADAGLYVQTCLYLYVCTFILVL